MTAYNFLLRHFRVGCTSLVLLLDIPVVIALLVDLLRAVFVSHSLVYAFSEAWAKISVDTILSLAKVLSLGIIVVPIVVAVFVVLLRAGPPLHGRLEIPKRRTIFIHTGIWVWLSIGGLVGFELESLSGEVLIGDHTVYLFSSMAATLFLYLDENVVWITSTFTALALPYLLKACLRSDGDTGFDEYESRLVLSDIGGELYPSHGPAVANFNGGAIAPEIRWARHYAEKMARKYQRFVPGSERARQYLVDRARLCRENLQRTYGGCFDGGKLDIEFFPSTSRALEVAIARIPGPKCVVLSPYEHPSEKEVAGWVQEISGDRCVPIRFNGPDFEKAWDDQRAQIVSAFTTQRKKIESENQAALSSKARPLTYVLVISQVCYATGQIIRASDLASAMKSTGLGKRLRVIVDGSHGIGNVDTHVSWSWADACVLSAHKWLLAPEPMGVCVTPGVPGSRNAYDSWRASLPVTTAGIRQIAGFLTGLRLLGTLPPGYAKDRSTRLQRRFMATKPRKWRIVGGDSDLELSHLMAVEPAEGWKWRPPADKLQDWLRDAGIAAEVIPFAARHVWVRLSFVYFLEDRHVRTLVRALDAAMVRE